MSKRKERNTKGKIVSAAWKLFYEQGYDNTTIEEIIDESGTSKGSFYHYFDGKDSLLSSLSYLFDDKYLELEHIIDENMNAFDKLMYLNVELFDMVENTISIDLLTQLYSSQLITKGERHLLDSNRVYFIYLRKIIIDGQKKNELRNDFSVNEIVKAYALCERAFLYDWCLCGGSYSLKNYSKEMMPQFLSFYKNI